VARCCRYKLRRQIEQRQDDCVGVLRLDSKLSQDAGRKIAEVGGDDHIGFTANRGRQHMPVIRIGKVQTVNQVFLIEKHQVGPALARLGSRSSQMTTTTV
jgi:hypothetical protein